MKSKSFTNLWIPQEAQVEGHIKGHVLWVGPDSRHNDDSSFLALELLDWPHAYTSPASPRELRL